MIRTFTELETALDGHRFSKLHSLTLAAINAGNAGDVREFATSLASHCRQQTADVIAFGDEPSLLAGIRDERAARQQREARRELARARRVQMERAKQWMAA